MGSPLWISRLHGGFERGSPYCVISGEMESHMKYLLKYQDGKDAFTTPVELPVPPVVGDKVTKDGATIEIKKRRFEFERTDGWLCHLEVSDA